MSYANGTPNFNLPQTVGSDKRDWADTNQAFLAVDTALKTAGDTAGAASTAASTAQAAANAADTKATNAQTAATGAQATATSAAELAQSAKNRADAAYTAAGNAATAASGAQATADAALPKTSVVDNLTTNDATKALSAKQGKALNDSKLANSRLTANGNNAQLSYVNGVYGFTIGGTFYPLGGGGMPFLDFANPLHTFTTSAAYTCTQDCWLCGMINNTGTISELTINGTKVQAGTYGTGGSVLTLRLKQGDTVSCNTGGAALHIFAER